MRPPNRSWSRPAMARAAKPETCWPMIGATRTPNGSRTPRAGGGNGPGTADLAWCSGRDRGPVGSQYNARVEHREKRVELTTPRSGEEGVHNFSLTNSIGIGNRRCTLDPAPCAAGELPGRGWGAIHDWSDLFEGQAKHVMQHERDPFGRSQRLQDHEQRGTDRVGHDNLLLGVGPVQVTCDRLRLVGAKWLLAPSLA